MAIERSGVGERGAPGTDPAILANSKNSPSAPDSIIDLDMLPDFLRAHDIMRILNVSERTAYRLIHNAGGVRYGTAKRHTVSLPKSKLLTIIRELSV